MRLTLLLAALLLPAVAAAKPRTFSCPEKVKAAATARGLRNVEKRLEQTSLARQNAINRAFRSFQKRLARADKFEREVVEAEYEITLIKIAHRFDRKEARLRRAQKALNLLRGCALSA